MVLDFHIFILERVLLVDFEDFQINLLQYCHMSQHCEDAVEVGGSYAENEVVEVDREQNTILIRLKGIE